MRKVIHVVPRGNEGWAAKTEHTAKASVIKPTKEQAVKIAIKQAKNAGQGQVVIHGQNGQIQEERTYGNDPYPPKG